MNEGTAVLHTILCGRYDHLIVQYIPAISRIEFYSCCTSSADDCLAECHDLNGFSLLRTLILCHCPYYKPKVSLIQQSFSTLQYYPGTQNGVLNSEFCDGVVSLLMYT